MLVTDNITFHYKQEILLARTSITVHSGELVALCGPNGAGKTTLLKILAKQLSPSAGTIGYNDIDLDDIAIAELAKIRAVMPQEISVSFNFSVADVIAMGLVFASTAEQKQIIDHVACEFDVSHFLHRAYNDLSGGEKQRVQLARVVGQLMQKACPRQRYLLLDECTSAMDIAMVHKVFSSLKNLLLQDIAIVAIVHDVNLASLYADKIILLKQGEVLAFDRVEKIITVENIGKAFDTKVEVIAHPVCGKPIIVQNRLV